MYSGISETLLGSEACRSDLSKANQKALNEVQRLTRSAYWTLVYQRGSGQDAVGETSRSEHERRNYQRETHRDRKCRPVALMAPSPRPMCDDHTDASREGCLSDLRPIPRPAPLP